MEPRKLIEKAREGDKEAFGKLYELYYLPVYRYIHFRIDKKEDAQDLVQIVFLKVYQSIERYQERGKEPLSYFFTVARNTVIDYLRKKRELKLYEDSNIEEREKDNPEKISEVNEEARIVGNAIRNLNEDQKEVILLKFMAGLSNTQTAEQLNKKEDAIRQIQHRALKILKNKLKKIYG